MAATPRGVRGVHIHALLVHNRVYPGIVNCTGRIPGSNLGF